MRIYRSDVDEFELNPQTTTDREPEQPPDLRKKYLRHNGNGARGTTE